MDSATSRDDIADRDATPAQKRRARTEAQSLSRRARRSVKSHGARLSASQRDEILTTSKRQADEMRSQAQRILEDSEAQRVQAEADTLTGAQWITRLERAKVETLGQKTELRRLWGVMKDELKLQPKELKKVEKHFKDDHQFQNLLNIEGIEEEW